jgi:hypothetical protein
MQGAAGDWLSGGSFELAPAAAAGTPASSPRLPAAGGERGGRGWVGLGILWGWSRPARCGFDFLLTRAAAAAARRHHGGASRRVVLPSTLPPSDSEAQRKREGNETNRWGVVVSRGTRREWTTWCFAAWRGPARPGPTELAGCSCRRVFLVSRPTRASASRCTAAHRTRTITTAMWPSTPIVYLKSAVDAAGRPRPAGKVIFKI